MRRLVLLAVISNLLVAAASVAGYAAGDIDLHPGIIGTDDRQPIAINGPPWTAIGQVNVGGYRTRSRCTGTLIAPRLVLTAAHCVIDSGKKTPFLNRNIHFVAGVHRDTSVGAAPAACVKFPDGYHYRAPEQLLPDLPFQRATFENFKRDLAIIVLANDLPGVTPVDAAPDVALSNGMSFIHASYPSDRRYILSIQRGCKAIGMNADVVATDCDTHPGSSGGPLLVESSGKLVVVAVLSGLVAKKASIFVPLSNWPDLPLDGRCP